MNIVIQGAGRGLGLALARRASAAGPHHLFLTARDPEQSEGFREIGPSANVTWLQVDFTEPASVERAGATICDKVENLSRVICTAGVLIDANTRPEKRIADINVTSLLHSYQVNAAGPLLLMKSLWPCLRGNHETKIASLSARVGSISDNRLGGWYSYRASKAAQNQLMHTMAIELARSNPAACVATLHPGTVDTGLSKPFHANVPPDKLFTPDYSAGRLWRVLDDLTSENSGGFFAYDGSPIPF